MKLMNYRQNNSQFKNQIATEINLMLIALAFFTRIPVSNQVDYSPQMLNQASRYFSLIGCLVGGLCAIVFLIANIYLSDNIAIVLSMLFGILLTGSFHEDGLIDTSDGFGGGWDAKQKLKIMKDSRIGSYGAVALWFALSLKFYSLNEVTSVILALLIAHPLSRSLSTSLIYFLPYVANESQSKVKPLAEKLRMSDLIINMMIGLTPLLFLGDLKLIHMVQMLLGLIVLFVALKELYHRQIGGFTGDTLGASQQVFEIAIYISLVILL